MLNQVASGYCIKDHGSVLHILPIIFQEITYKGKKYDTQTLIEISKENYDEKDPLYDFALNEIFLYVFMDELNANGSYVLQKDMKFDSDNSVAVHVEDPNIVVGNPTTCAFMIYIVSAGEYSTGNKGVSDETLLRLICWKQKLVREGRMKDTFFDAIPNCCS